MRRFSRHGKCRKKCAFFSPWLLGSGRRNCTSSVSFADSIFALRIPQLLSQSVTCDCAARTTQHVRIGFWIRAECVELPAYGPRIFLESRSLHLSPAVGLRSWKDGAVFCQRTQSPTRVAKSPRGQAEVCQAAAGKVPGTESPFALVDSGVLFEGLRNHTFKNSRSFSF